MPDLCCVLNTARVRVGVAVRSTRIQSSHRLENRSNGEFERKTKHKRVSETVSPENRTCPPGPDSNNNDYFYSRRRFVYSPFWRWWTLCCGLFSVFENEPFCCVDRETDEFSFCRLNIDSHTSVGEGCVSIFVLWSFLAVGFTHRV